MTVVQSRHTLDWCGSCVCDRVLCADCGNNCCNGGTGRSIYDKDCDCEEAYAHQELFWSDPASVIFVKDTRPPVEERVWKDQFADIRDVK